MWGGLLWVAGQLCRRNLGHIRRYKKVDEPSLKNAIDKKNHP
jgi:hypothetical protein